MNTSGLKESRPSSGLLGWATLSGGQLTPRRDNPFRDRLEGTAEQVDQAVRGPRQGRLVPNPKTHVPTQAVWPVAQLQPTPCIFARHSTADVHPQPVRYLLGCGI